MPSFIPFTSVSGKHACTLFEIRLDNDFIVFRGDDHEASGQLLQGTVVLCLSAPLKIEDVHLKLTGTSHYSWTDARVAATGVSSQRIDKTFQFLDHRWRPFIGVGAQDHSPDGSGHHSRGLTLPPGNYEWPFQLMLGGDTTESVEGMHEAGITYKLRATVARGKLAHDLHAYKRLRVIRTLQPSALEFLHAMSVENIWPNKIEYSIVVPQKAVVFGSAIPVQMRFTPLLKGLELGDLRIRLVEMHDIILHTQAGHGIREHKKEREIDSWVIPVTRDEHWNDMIDEDGQEGWVVNASLSLPRKLSKCLQDVNARGIKIRHKLKLVVALNNPDGHVSELRATLPVTIFISPNMPLDEEGNLVRQMPHGASSEAATIAPPSYSEHMLDQLYEDIDPISLQTPTGGRSGVNSPLRAHSRAGSSENLAAAFHGAAVSPALLSSRLQSMSLEERHRSNSWNSTGPRADSPPRAASDHSLIVTPAPASAPLTRHNSGSSGIATPEHIDFSEMADLSKVPSYHTAVRTPVRPLNFSDGLALPDYRTATTRSAPASPQLGGSSATTPTAAPQPPPPPPPDTLDAITEAAQEPTNPTPAAMELGEVGAQQQQQQHQQASRSRAHRRHLSSPFQLPHVFHMLGEGDERRRLLHAGRERVA